MIYWNFTPLLSAPPPVAPPSLSQDAWQMVTTLNEAAENSTLVKISRSDRNRLLDEIVNCSICLHKSAMIDIVYKNSYNRVCSTLLHQQALYVCTLSVNCTILCILERWPVYSSLMSFGCLPIVTIHNVNNFTGNSIYGKQILHGMTISSHVPFLLASPLFCCPYYKRSQEIFTMICSNQRHLGLCLVYVPVLVYNCNKVFARGAGPGST